VVLDGCFAEDTCANVLELFVLLKRGTFSILRRQEVCFLVKRTNVASKNA
jgi:hypothetical protein